MHRPEAWKGQLIMKKFFLAAALGGLALLGVQNAQANSIIITATDSTGTASYTVGDVFTPPANGSNFDYFYRLAITPTNQMNQNDFAEVFDFSGYVPGTIQFTPSAFSSSFGGTFSATVQTLTTGINIEPGSVNAVLTLDNPAVFNLVVTYNGLTPITSGTFTNLAFPGGKDGSGNVILGILKGTSTLFTPRIDGYVAQDHFGNVEAENTGTTFVPGLPGGGELPLPLPTAAWGGMALIGLLGGSRLRRAKKA